MNFPVLTSIFLCMLMTQASCEPDEDEDIDDTANFAGETYKAKINPDDFRGNNRDPRGEGPSMVFSPPVLTDEENHSKFMPTAHKCDGCIAVAYQLETDAFPNAEKKTRKKDKLKTSDIIDATEKLCSTGFDDYGLKNLGENKKALSGKGLVADKAGGMMEGGGKWQARLQVMCKELVEVFEEDGLYDLYLNRGGRKLSYFLCNDHCRGAEHKKINDEL